MDVLYKNMKGRGDRGLREKTSVWLVSQQLGARADVCEYVWCHEQLVASHSKSDR